jgi:hypothetical protein
MRAYICLWTCACLRISQFDIRRRLTHRHTLGKESKSGRARTHSYSKVCSSMNAKRTVLLTTGIITAYFGIPEKP